MVSSKKAREEHESSRTPFFYYPEEGSVRVYYNHEHYPDPTAGAAIANITREERRRMTQKQFYKSRAWRRTRDAYIAYREAIDGGVCEVCGHELGKVVHHKTWLNNDNCNDPDVALNFKNLRYECQTCHNQERDPDRATGCRCRYGPNGEVLRDTEY